MERGDLVMLDSSVERPEVPQSHSSRRMYRQDQHASRKVGGTTVNHPCPYVTSVCEPLPFSPEGDAGVVAVFDDVTRGSYLGDYVRVDPGTVVIVLDVRPDLWCNFDDPEGTPTKVMLPDGHVGWTRIENTRGTPELVGS